jgi:hypothetical protein
VRATRSSERLIAAAAVVAALAAGCQRQAASPTTAVKPAGSPAGTQVVAPAVYSMALPVLPDSALKVVRFALGTIDGSIQLPQIRPKLTTISTHYTRNRRGGGHTQVAVMVAIDRRPLASESPATAIELSAWALDLAQPTTASQRRSGMPQTPVSTNAPALRRPRAVTPNDTSEFRVLLTVLEEFQRLGARKHPE